MVCGTGTALGTVVEKPAVSMGAAAVSASGSNLGPLTISNQSFHFGTEVVGFSLTRTVAVVTNTSKRTVPLQSLLTGNPAYTLVVGGAGSNSCGTSLGAAASCNLDVTYAPQTASTPAKQKASLLFGSIDGKKFSFFDIALTGLSGAMPPGVVSQTGNTMVAQYALTLPFAGTWNVAFGPTTDYGKTTSVVANTTPGTASSIYVAGMQANTAYHMRASVTLANGATVTDVDHTFSTGALPAGIVPPTTVTTTPGLTPQPGVELINTITGGTRTTVYATDLAGNPIWTYLFPDTQQGSLLYPAKLMPNGNLLMMIAVNSAMFAPLAPSVTDVIREIDLAGNTVQELPMSVLNTRLQAAGFNLTLEMFSHDIQLLPNGHMLVMANLLKAFPNFEGAPGVTNILGDAIVDLDPNMQPVWVWNEFDHFDVHRHPMSFPDWTHSNAVLYSPDDGNFLVSMRHQNWVVKVNYNNGQGDGSVLWRLGEQGDFTLQGGTDPQDWFYAQHNPSFFSPNSTGVFTLGLMDNGDDRAFPDGTNCLAEEYRCYTTIPVLRLDEVAKTATLVWHQVLSTNIYSSFAGDTFQLANGNVEYNLAGTAHDSHIFEVTQDASQTTVWHMFLQGTNTYRAYRVPSLYPGVQW